MSETIIKKKQKSPRGKPTLKTISQMTGLAVPTVSRALNNAPDIGEKTKILVRKIADEVGYVPNRAGVRLRTGRTNVISLVMSTEHDVMNHTARLISSVAGGLRATEYRLIVTPYFPDEDPMKPVRYIVETGSADAVILNQIQEEDPRIQYLMERNFPFATHGRTKWCDQHPYYDYDNQAFAEISMERMIKRGRKNISLIAPPQNHAYGKHMVTGARKVADARGIALRVEEGATSDMPSAVVKSYVAKMLMEKPETDAIITASTSSAMAIVAALESRGLKLEKDIDVCAKEAMPFLKLFREDIMTMAEQVTAGGEFLAKAAIQAVRQPELPPKQMVEVPTHDSQ